jgi:hypothetical protein
LTTEKLVNEYKVSETAYQATSPKVKVEKSKFSALSIFSREKSSKGSNDSITSTRSAGGRRSFFGKGSKNKE